MPPLLHGLTLLPLLLAPFAAYALTTGWMLDQLPWSSSLFLALWAGSVVARALYRVPKAAVALLLPWSLTWAVEALGVRTGLPFGAYRYTGLLWPELVGVPLVIPLAWVALLLLAMAWVEARLPQTGPIERILRVGLLLIGVDVLLEPMAAYAQRYWVWESDSVPLQNYVSWGVLGALLSALLWRSVGLLGLPISERPWLWGLAGVLLGLCALVGIAKGYWAAVVLGAAMLLGASLPWRRR
ncbi:MAG: carotenoid biosynthesis protein [Bacteroidota bacterium]|nr:carotenoid biosynthesis protein [Rhodothermia bacterium]MDW8285738.1 carotenoid biosynthesis protein [Bacteroidota bacterium]